MGKSSLPKQIAGIHQQRTVENQDILPGWVHKILDLVKRNITDVDQGDFRIILDQQGRQTTEGLMPKLQQQSVCFSLIVYAIGCIDESEFDYLDDENKRKFQLV